MNQHPATTRSAWLLTDEELLARTRFAAGMVTLYKYEKGETAMHAKAKARLRHSRMPAVLRQRKRF